MRYLSNMSLINCEVPVARFRPHFSDYALHLVNLLDPLNLILRHIVLVVDVYSLSQRI